MPANCVLLHSVFQHLMKVLSCIICLCSVKGEKHNPNLKPFLTLIVSFSLAPKNSTDYWVV